MVLSIAENKVKPNLIAQMENRRVSPGIPIALSQMRLTETTIPDYGWTPNNYPQLSPQTRTNMDRAVELAIVLGKKELRFR